MKISELLEVLEKYDRDTELFFDGLGMPINLVDVSMGVLDNVPVLVFELIKE